MSLSTWSTRAAAVATAGAASVCHAGFGGMAQIEDNATAGAPLSFLLYMAAGAGVGAAYGAIRNSRATKKMAIDGCVILGALAGMFLAPLVTLALR